MVRMSDSKTRPDERVPASAATQLLIRQFAQLQRVAADQLIAVAAQADNKPLGEGWRLDFESGMWLRLRPDEVGEPAR